MHKAILFFFSATQRLVSWDYILSLRLTTFVKFLKNSNIVRQCVYKELIYKRANITKEIRRWLDTRCMVENSVNLWLEYCIIVRSSEEILLERKNGEKDFITSKIWMAKRREYIHREYEYLNSDFFFIIQKTKLFVLPLNSACICLVKRNEFSYGCVS